MTDLRVWTRRDRRRPPPGAPAALLTLTFRAPDGSLIDERTGSQRRFMMNSNGMRGGCRRQASVAVSLGLGLSGAAPLTWLSAEPPCAVRAPSAISTWGGQRDPGSRAPKGQGCHYALESAELIDLE